MSIVAATPLLLLQQSIAPRDTAAIDSVVVESPLPGGAAAVARFLFSTVPQWVQIAGVIVGVLVALIGAVILVRRRREVLAWLSSRSRGWKLGMSALVLVSLGGVVAAGLTTWNYMMHDNTFCTSCHVMSVPFRKFTASEHSSLGCHDCHRQGMLDNLQELYVWVAERPEHIPDHAPVPNAICAECHIQNDPDSTWKRIVATAGHAVHLNPASPAMRRMECVTCHGQEVHRFKPAMETCAQSGCHDRIDIQLGKMAGQTSLHCAACHAFTAPAAETDTTRSARAALVPDQRQCLECHDMQTQMTDFVPENEPHKAVCGTCHNPHTQTTTTGAFQSCATSGCHARSDTLTAMHRGLTGRHKLETCGACHSAHTWKTDGTRCENCHSGISDPAVRVRPRRSASSASPAAGSMAVAGATARRAHSLPGEALRPVPRSTTRQAGAAHAPRNAGRVQRRRAFPSPLRIQPVALTRDDRPVDVSLQGQGRDTARFEHARHRPVRCTTCHSTQTEHGGLTAVARRCTSCHHAESAVGRDCARCHQPTELQAVQQITTAVQFTVPSAVTSKALPFAHGRHESLRCAECHSANLARSVERTCASCHIDHHTEARECSACHQPARQTHTRAVHETGCGGSGCHYREATPATSTARTVCVACHVEQATHKPGRDCATCHLTRWPTVARSAER